MLRLIKFVNSTVKVPIEAIKRLREETSSPIGECKKALEETGCNHEAALQWLRKKGMVTAEKKADKSTRYGVVAAITCPTRSSAVLVEVNCYTDFVAKNELFLKFVRMLLDRNLDNKSSIIHCDLTNEDQNVQQLDKLLASEKPLGLFEDTTLSNIFEEKKMLISKLQENIRVRRMLKLQSYKGLFGLYVHRAYQPNVGLHACVMELIPSGEVNKEEAADFADNIAAQYLGSPPKYLSEKDIPEDVMKQEVYKVKTDMAKALEKAPPAAHYRMIKGKLNSTLFSPYVFRHMPYILSSEGNSTVDQYWKESESYLGATFELGRIENWKCK